MANNPQILPGLFVETTQIWDVDLDNKENQRELLLRLYQNINSIALVLNIADKGYYVKQEFVTGCLWYPNPNYTSSTKNQPVYRPDFRIVVVGQLPGGAVPNPVLLPHNLDIPTPSQYTAVFIGATATNNTINDFRPIPYAAINPLETLQLRITATDVEITSGGFDYSNWTGNIVFKYLKI